MTKRTYKISGMHCASCAMNVEWELEDKGAKAKCNFAKEILEVEADFKKISDEEIEKTVESLGYKLVKTE
jgi:Cu+-exporting ATPase